MRYEITVKGTLDARWSDWFSGMTLTVEVRGDGRTLTQLKGWVSDQAALRGILIKLWDLNLTLISVTCIGSQEECDDTDLYPTFG
jgi:hypothetical protein